MYLIEQSYLQKGAGRVFITINKKRLDTLAGNHGDDVDIDIFALPFSWRAIGKRLTTYAIYFA
jgi:hypothetical protein